MVIGLSVDDSWILKIYSNYVKRKIYNHLVKHDVSLILVIHENQSANYLTFKQNIQISEWICNLYLCMSLKKLIYIV